MSKNTLLEYAWPVPQGWSLYDRDVMPGVPTLFHKDPDTHLLSPVPPAAMLPDNPNYLELSLPQRNIKPIWDISCRSTPNYGYNERVDMEDAANRSRVA